MLVLYLGTIQELQQQLILPLPSIKIAKVMTPPKKKKKKKKK